MYNIANYRVIGLCKMTVQQAAFIAVRNLMPVVLGLFSGIIQILPGRGSTLVYS